ncbi:MAG: Clp protease, partial [Pseudomonadota bacterium]
ESETANLVAIYARRTKRDPAEIAAMLAAETWMTASEAVAAGFADEVLSEEKPAPRPRAESAQARFLAALAAQVNDAETAETRRVLNLCNAASRVATPGQPGQPAVHKQDPETNTP